MTEQDQGDRIIVAGGGVGGLALALMLGRAGRRVSLVERDVVGSDLDPGSDPEAAFAAARRGVPQAHQTHGFLARLRLVLRDRLPDVLAEVEAAGARTLALTTELGERRPGDEDLAILIVRRTTLEWVLRRAVAAEPTVEVRSGRTVTGLVAAPPSAGADAGTGWAGDARRGGAPAVEPAPSGHGREPVVAGAPHGVDARSAGGSVLPETGAAGVSQAVGARSPGGAALPGPVVAGVPHVVGARLAGDEVLRGTVVACTGSRGDVPAWLAELGVEVPEDEHQTKLIYLTRWYRLPADQPPAELGGRLFGDLGYLRYLVVPGDGGTLSATLAVHVRDRELRAQLIDGDRFDRAVRRLPGPDRFFAPGPVEALGPVRPMAGLVNRLRRFVDDRQQPLVTGFHAVGDAHTCTNPLYGRGCALAMVQAGLLADAFAAHPGDPWARAVDYEAATAREVEPWFHGSVQMDRLRDKVEARRRARTASTPPTGNGATTGAATGPAVRPAVSTAKSTARPPGHEGGTAAAVGEHVAGEGAVMAGETGALAVLPAAEQAPSGSTAGGGEIGPAAVPVEQADEGGNEGATGGSAAVATGALAEEPGDEGEMAAATFGRIMVEGGSDPVIGRAIIRLFNLLVLPHELLADAELLARVAPLLAKPPQARPEPEGPTLAELLA